MDKNERSIFTTDRQCLYEAMLDHKTKLQEWDTALKSGDYQKASQLQQEASELEKRVRAYKDFTTAIEGSADIAADEDERRKALAKAFTRQIDRSTDPALQAAVKSLAKAAREGFHVVEKAQGDQMQGSVDADGGYIVPKDIVTHIQELIQTQESLLDLVSSETVSSKEGRRTLPKAGTKQRFQTTAEAAKSNKLQGPQFDVLNYAVEKRDGYLLVTLELLQDTDANLAAYIMAWFAEVMRNTVNYEVVECAKTGTTKQVKSLAELKAAYIKLPSCFRSRSKLITNDDGLLWLDGLQDKNGRSLLQPDPTTKKLVLCVGPYSLPIETYENDSLPNNSTKIPMLIGDLKQGIRYWIRDLLTIRKGDQATVGNVNTFEQDMVAYKGSIRDDCTLWDKRAFVYCELDPSPAAAAADVTPASGA